MDYYCKEWDKLSEEDRKKENIQPDIYRANWEKLTPYRVECVKPNSNTITKNSETTELKDDITGSIRFSDLPKSMLDLLLFSLSPGDQFAHKLGALKPLGFGSVQFIVREVEYREMNNVFDDPQCLLCNKFDDPHSKNQDLSIQFTDIKRFADDTAWNWLETIHKIPDWDSDDTLFVYPQYSQRASNPYLKGFANPQGRSSTYKEHDNKMNPQKNEKVTEKDKITLYFDIYQKYAKNFKTILGNIKNYSHLPYERIKGDE